jgi:hypothetical protein
VIVLVVVIYISHAPYHLALLLSLLHLSYTHTHTHTHTQHTHTTHRRKDFARLHQALQTSSFMSTPAMADQDQDRASPEITTDTARPDSVNFIITTGPDVSLTPKQKQFLARKLTITQEKKFAAPFLSSDGADSSDTSTEQASTSLEMVLSKTLEDKYSSGLAFQDDVQLMVDNARGHGALQGGNTEHGNKMLEHVKRFMRRMPSSTKPLPRNSQPDHRVKRPNTGDKRKATESAEMQLPVKKPRPRNNTAPSDAQEKQMRYARNQVEAYRRGINSNHGKTIRNLVLEKVDHLLEEERKLKVKELEKRQRQERTAGLTIGSQGNNKKGGEEAGEVEGAKRVSDTERSQAQPSLEITKLITVKSYQEKLAELSTQLPSEKQMDDIIRASRAGPNFVGRTASLVRGERFGQYHKKTNGHTSYDVLLPAADCRSARFCSHSQLQDMTQGELKYMIGNHLIWKDLVVDEFLSYSKDPLFLVVHALRRHHENQGNVTIQFLDRRQAKTPSGEPAVLYSALDLYTIFGVPKWSGWGLNDITKLHPRKFTQELLSHGPVLISDTTLKQASIGDLINDGLFKIFSEFDTPGDHKRAGLYTLQVVYRKIGYPPETPHDATNRAAGPIYSYENCARQVPMTEELLETVRKVTLNFRARPKGVDVETLEPPLHAFIGFLTFEKRQKEDPVFMEWIKKHYKGTVTSPVFASARYANMTF